MYSSSCPPVQCSTRYIIVLYERVLNSYNSDVFGENQQYLSYSFGVDVHYTRYVAVRVEQSKCPKVCTPKGIPNSDPFGLSIGRPREHKKKHRSRCSRLYRSPVLD